MSTIPDPPDSTHLAAAMAHWDPLVRAGSVVCDICRVEHWPTDAAYTSADGRYLIATYTLCNCRPHPKASDTYILDLSWTPPHCAADGCPCRVPHAGQYCHGHPVTATPPPTQDADGDVYL